MSLFFETIHVINGEIQNLHYHNARLNQTIQANYNIQSKIDLRHYIKQSNPDKERCKVLYTSRIKEVQFFTLTPRKVQSLKVLQSNITYNFKNADREEIDKLFCKREDCDDILIVKDGFITDTSIANIAYHDGTNWITPKKPLLLGTMRASLIEKQLILEKDVKIEDIEKATRFALMNALIGFQEVKGLNIVY
jgi:4-amino-4-deoxychorismate lyase